MVLWLFNGGNFLCRAQPLHLCTNARCITTPAGGRAEKQTHRLLTTKAPVLKKKRGRDGCYLAAERFIPVSHCARRRTSTALRSTPPTPQRHPEHSKTPRKQKKKENTGWEKCLRRPVQHHHHTNTYWAVRVTWWSTAAETQRGELEASRAAGDVGGGECPCCFWGFF